MAFECAQRHCTARFQCVSGVSYIDNHFGFIALKTGNSIMNALHVYLTISTVTRGA